MTGLKASWVLEGAAVPDRLAIIGPFGEGVMNVASGAAAGGDDALAATLESARVATADIALITDSEQAIVYVSAAFTAMTGYEQDDLVGQNCSVLQGPGTDPSTKRRMREAIASQEVFEGEVLNYRKNGSAFWTALKIIPMRVGSDAAVTHYVSSQRDVSNRVALITRLQSQALHDTVTGLPNRSVAEHEVSEAVKNGVRRDVTAAVGLIDLDDFRLVNNELGHAAGDDVLRQWAARMLSLMREDHVLARMGGDEFILIFTSVSRNEAKREVAALLDRIHRAVEQPFEVEGRLVRIGMSLGIALVPESGADSRSILHSADEALYRAKKNRAERTTWWEIALRPGAEDENPAGEVNVDLTSDPDHYGQVLLSGGVEIRFQPVVDLQKGGVHLFEVLARLRLSDGRIVAPDEFLPHLSADGLSQLFERVLDKALETLAAWDQLDSRHQVSVNLPPQVLLNHALPALVRKMLDTHDIAPERLGLELLETADVDLDHQRATLRELVHVGVGLALDDLGSGYSSLQRLSSFPFSAIKLDRGLLRHIWDRPVETLNVIATLIQLGRDLGMNVVIEGLENQSLTEAATILGAPLGQGFYFAEPMAADECLRWAASCTTTVTSTTIHTPLGALAYHLQFARLAAPHPVVLDTCPFTAFLAGTDASAEVMNWHAHQHEVRPSHPGSSHFLMEWLIPHIRENWIHDAAGSAYG